MGKKTMNPEGWLTSVKERRVYWMYFAGQNMIYAYVTMFLATYLLLSGLGAAATAGVMMAVKVWDAVNDIIFGALIDKVKFKKGGRFIPWLRISLPIIAVTTLLLFGIPGGLEQNMKLVWFAVAYILFDAAYTICDVPVYGLVTNMTNVQAERTELMAKSRITSYVGVIIVLGFGYILPTEQVGMSFTAIARIVVVIAFFTMIWLCLYGKEHLGGYREKEETYTLKEMFRYLARNKYLFIFFGGLLVSNGLNTALPVIQFTSFYLFNSAMLATLIAAIGFAPSVILAFFLPALLKRFDKMKMLLVSAASFTVISIIIWAVGPVLVPHLILSVFRGFAFGGITVLQFMFTPDCAEYGQYKTGTEAKGITFAVQTFTMKLTAAIQSALALAVLGWFGWKSVAAESFAELAALGVSQSESALTGLWTVYSLIPTIGGALAFLIWTRYKLKPADVEIMAKYNIGEITREECEKNLTRKY